MKVSASNAPSIRRAQVVLLLLASCSFQKFDYLEDGGGSAASGAGGGSAAGSGNQQSGADNAGGTEQNDVGGSAGKGGKGSNPVTSAGDGSLDEGGAPGAAGDPSVGGSQVGGTTSGTGGAGGTAGTGNTGATGQLVNPSFETGTTSGWTVAPDDALSKRYAFVQYPQGASSVPDGTYQFSTWHMTDAYTVQLSQVIKGLEDGTYTFKAYFSRGAQNSAQLFARNCGGTVEPTPVDIPITSGTEWVPVSVAGIEVVGGECEVGLALDSNPENWLNADLFTFEKEAE